MKNEQLCWGDRVKGTKLAVEKGIILEGQEGICLGEFRNSKLSIWVVKDGRHIAQGYHTDFWEKIHDHIRRKPS